MAAHETIWFVDTYSIAAFEELENVFDEDSQGEQFDYDFYGPDSDPDESLWGEDEGWPMPWPEEEEEEMQKESGTGKEESAEAVLGVDVGLS